MHAFLKNPRHRTLLGLTLGVLFVPVMLGITACLETPIGDPERGWVDPRITGVWMAGEISGDGVEEAMVWVFEPYDQRTWLVTWYSFDQVSTADEAGPDAGSGTPETGLPVVEDGVASAADGQSADDAGSSDEPPPRLTPDQVRQVVAALNAEELTADEEFVAFKSWLTSIGKSRYLVLEPKLVLTSDRGFDPDVWFAFRLVLRDGAMGLSLVDLPAGIKTRGEAETTIAARADDPDLAEPFATLAPVPEELYDDIARWTAHGDAF